MARKLAFLLCFAFILSGAGATRFYHEEHINSSPNKLSYKLAHQNLVSASESITGQGVQLFRGIHYRIDYKSGTVSFEPDALSASFWISYLIIPPELTKPKQLYQRTDLSDSLNLARPGLPTFRPASDGKLNISGSKTFSLSLSESGDTDLLQSLYVNLDGELSSNIFINAQLSDSQSKLSPEGDSKELSSLDQVFIRIHGKGWELGMGDLDLSFNDSHYLNFYNKIEGIKFKYDARHQAMAAFSAGSGKRASTKLSIIDGKQGPYYLTPDATQRSFIIIAGTEEIHLDGKLLERGRDYTIDYSEGSIMFRFLVSSHNSVIAWFQYSDENYRQNSYFSSSQLKINPNLSFFHHLIHQQDSKSQPLLFSFTDADKDSLYHAGDNHAYSSGIIPVETGSGSYVLKTDSLGNKYFEYAPADEQANYELIFSYLGAGLGDYEEFLPNRFRYAGIGQGAWMPLKRLIAPAMRSNLEFGFDLSLGKWQNSVEFLYSHLDQNTFSPYDDGDNSGGIASLNISRGDSPLRLGLSAQYRLPNTYLPAQGESISQDLASLDVPDFPGMQTLDLSAAYHSPAWRPSLFFRLRNLEDQYTQKALRLSSDSMGKGIIPALNFSGTLSDQDGNDQSFLQYHDLRADWRLKLIAFKLGGIFSENRYPEYALRNYKLSPALELTHKNCFSSVGYTIDLMENKEDVRENQSKQQTYSIAHNSSFGAQHLNLEFSHRSIENTHSQDEGKNAFQLFRFNNSNSLFKGALSLFGNYQLNQTEFYPRIRELVYVGTGFGYYDSTGVAIDHGEYIYEYITSDSGKLSSELSFLTGIYLKPGQYLKAPFWKRLHGDVSISASEQNDELNSWQSFLFLPNYVFNDDTIYGRQSLMQNLYFDILEGRIISSISLENSRDIDQRYQSPEKRKDAIARLQLDLRGYLGLNTRLSLENSDTHESRYNSHSNSKIASANMEKILGTRSTASLDVSASTEEGKDQNSADSYRMSSIALSPSLRSVLMQKYRISARFGMGYNDRKGSDYLNFLPAKREGFFSDAALSATYRINDYSSMSFEYRGSKFPQDKISHNLKFEFRAEL